MPFEFGKKDDATFNTTLNAKGDLEEIKKIAEHLETDETVLVVAKRPRIKTGGLLATPNVIFATDRRLIIKDPSALGLRQSVEDIGYDRIASAQLDKGVFSSSIILHAPGFSTMSEKSSTGSPLARAATKERSTQSPRTRPTRYLRP